MGIIDDTQPLVVALGASAGGLAALQEFFTELPPNATGMTYVVIQHLSPNHKSVMQELLTRHTSMAVKVAADGDALQEGTIFLNPPATYLSCEEGRLRVWDKEQHPHLPIDHFLGSLAKEAGERAVAIVLSGTGSDGSRGLLAIKEAGGLVMAQEESSAEYNGMPQAAIDTGAVDFVLPPTQLAAELGIYIQHRARLSPWEQASPDVYTQVLAALREKTNIDFSEYKKETLVRRIHRRMAVRQVRNLSDYAQMVRDDLQEANLLLRDILIGVTRFFRDPAAFQALAQQTIQTLMEGPPAGDTIRVWVPGCSTGEEAYSLVILFLEQAASLGRSLNLKLFATDLDREALRIAGKGCYPDSIAEDVSATRLQRYFVARPGGGFQVAASLRDRVVFSLHNLVKDPPFTGLDLVSCRNVLIYFESELQKRALSYLHFALKPGGYLFLGSSETTGDRQEAFLCSDVRFRVYQKLGVSAGLYRWPTRSGLRSPGTIDPKKETAQVVDMGYRRLLEEYCPPAILVDQSGELLHVLVRADSYLKIPPGAVRLDLSSLLPLRLGALAASAIHRLLHGPEPLAGNGDGPEGAGRELVVQEPGWKLPVAIKVRPLRDSQGNRRYALITFREVQAVDSAPLPAGSTGIDLNAESEQQILQLRHELQLAREDFQTTVEELETTNEELQATNEELMASGQEFETTSDQLRQDLALANEELYALTHEHTSRIQELTELNVDMQNFLNSGRQAVLFLDEQLNVRRSTPSVTRYISVLDRDVGRPVEHLACNFSEESFLEEARQVVKAGTTIKRDLCTKDGQERFRLTLHPYPCGPDKRGVVVTFNGTTEMDLGYTQAILEALEDPVTVLGSSGVIERVNQAWCRLAPASSGPGSYLPDLIRGWGEQAQAAADGLVEALAAQVEEQSWDYSRVLDGQTRRFRMRARRVQGGPGEVLVTHRDLATGG